MAVVVADVKVYIGETGADFDGLLADCLSEAQALVTKYNVKYDSTTETYVATSAPEVIVDRAVVTVAADLFNRRNAPNGVVNQQFENFGGDQGQAVRIARDPMNGAYKILQRWVLPW